MKEKIQNHFKGNYKAFYERFLQDIKDGKNSEFKALCPFHDDHNPSFNFNNQDGKYFCHSCQAGGDIFHFYAKLNGLDLKSDFYKILEGIVNEYGISWIEEKPHIVKTYDYVDAHDNLLFQVVRMDPKDFRQRRPDGKDGWIWNLNGIQRVLYRLPEVLKAKEVFIVEGEKDADTLVDLELTATTCPMGAKKWRPEYNESLKGKDIVLIPDNDNEGQEHMTQVGASLDGLVKSLKLIELPGLPNKGDVSDFVARFDDKIEAAEKVCIMVEGAGPYEPPKKATLEDAILKAEEFINNVEIPPKDKILEPWFNEQTITLISSPRGIGKTWLAMSLVDAISRGEPFGPWKLKKSVPCTYIEGEMAAQDVRDRLHALNRSEAPRLQGGASKRKL